MDAAKVSALLGRTLTPSETSNFDLYLKIARESLEEMLCTTLCDSDDPKIYDARVGYSTLFTDIFTDIDEVKLDGNVVDEGDYSIRQWEKRSGKWYNSLVFKDRLECEEVEVSGSWGFGKNMPSDLQLMQARFFDLLGRETKLNREINSKKVEDFTITYNHSSITMSDSLRESFVKDNAATIAKYSMCSIGAIRHGVLHGC